MDGWMADGGLDRKWINRWIDEEIVGWMTTLMDRKMTDWMGNGQIDEWKDGRMTGYK